MTEITMAGGATAGRSADVTCYEHLCSHLPQQLIDCHVHIGLPEHWGPVSPERQREIWALEVSRSHNWEDYRANYSVLFPKQDVSALVFGWVYREVDIERNNDYVLQGVRQLCNNAAGLYVTRPEWDAECIRQAMSHGFVGIKPYPDLAPGGIADSSIYDFVPRSHLTALNELCGILMLHLPRVGRLADPDNIRELREIADSYPDIKLVVAHMGRAYCLPDAVQGLPQLVGYNNVYFDTAANLNPDVFAFAIDTVGSNRILFGSDLPITLMRGVREHTGDRYINYTDGPYSWNTNHKSAMEESEYTYYLYEEVRSIISAAMSTGVGQAGLERIFYSNAAGLLGDLAHTVDSTHEATGAGAGLPCPS